MIMPNDKRREWTICLGDISSMGFCLTVKGPSVTILEADKGIPVVAMADVQPLVEAATVIILTASLYDDYVGHIPAADLKNLRSALEKWNGK